MAPAEILQALQTLGVSVAADGNALKLLPQKLVPAELVAQLRQHKAALLAILRGADPTSDAVPPSSCTHARIFERGDETLVCVACSMAQRPGAVDWQAQVFPVCAKHEPFPPHPGDRPDIRQCRHCSAVWTEEESASHEPQAPRQAPADARAQIAAALPVLRRLLATGWRVAAVQGEVSVFHANRKVTPPQRRVLAQHRDGLLALAERWEEKAALLEYNDDYPKGEAELLAWGSLALDSSIADSLPCDRCQQTARYPDFAAGVWRCRHCVPGKQIPEISVADGDGNVAADS